MGGINAFNMRHMCRFRLILWVWGVLYKVVPANFDEGVWMVNEVN